MNRTLWRCALFMSFLVLVLPCIAGSEGQAGDDEQGGGQTVQEKGSGQGNARNLQQKMVTANLAYDAGKWSEAIHLYETVLAQAGFSASLWYNLANGYARNGRIGLAIVGYERALLLSAGMGSDIRNNLHQVRQAHNLLPNSSWLQKGGSRLAGLLGLDQWAVVTAATLMALLLLHLVALRLPVSPRRSSLLIWATGIGFFLCGLGGTGVIIQYQRWQQAVVITPASPLLISPFAGAQSTQVSQEGRLIRILQRHNNYALVEDETGLRGWLAESSFMAIALPVSISVPAIN